MKTTFLLLSILTTVALLCALPAMAANDHAPLCVAANVTAEDAGHIGVHPTFPPDGSLPAELDAIVPSYLVREPLSGMPDDGRWYACVIYEGPINKIFFPDHLVPSQTAAPYIKWRL